MLQIFLSQRTGYGIEQIDECLPSKPFARPGPLKTGT